MENETNGFAIIQLRCLVLMGGNGRKPVFKITCTIPCKFGPIILNIKTVGHGLFHSSLGIFSLIILIQSRKRVIFCNAIVLSQLPHFCISSWVAFQYSISVIEYSSFCIHNVLSMYMYTFDT